MKLSPRHLKRYKEIAKEFELIDVPQPVPDCCTKRVRTMNHVRDKNITKIGSLARLELDNYQISG